MIDLMLRTAIDAGPKPEIDQNARHIRLGEEDRIESVLTLAIDIPCTARNGVRGETARATESRDAGGDTSTALSHRPHIGSKYPRRTAPI